jgi:hypothetical protein
MAELLQGVLLTCSVNKCAPLWLAPNGVGASPS